MTTTKSKICVILGNNISKLRKAMGMSQEKLAEQIDMGITSLSIIETGKGFITASNLEKIAEVLGVEESILFKASEDEDEEVMYKNILKRIEKYRNDKDKLTLLETFINAMH